MHIHSYTCLCVYCGRTSRMRSSSFGWSNRKPLSAVCVSPVRGSEWVSEWENQRGRKSWTQTERNHTHTHTHMHTYLQPYTHAHTDTDIHHACMHVNMAPHAHTNTHTHTHTHTHRRKRIRAGASIFAFARSESCQSACFCLQRESARAPDSERERERGTKGERDLENLFVRQWVSLSLLDMNTDKYVLTYTFWRDIWLRVRQ